MQAIWCFFVLLSLAVTQCVMNTSNIFRTLRTCSAMLRHFVSGGCQDSYRMTLEPCLYFYNVKILSWFWIFCMEPKAQSRSPMDLRTEQDVFLFAGKYWGASACQPWWPCCCCCWGLFSKARNIFWLWTIEDNSGQRGEASVGAQGTHWSTDLCVQSGCACDWY